ncbi:RDD family protein [Trichloromonas sp.]|uniref:RDD family protein n=1 Tax=Trichloromonas sp. TaxID=3069249 RepID=UPI003D81AAA4
MKCPKCGYHSFDYLDNCKKCDNDLAAFKSKFNLRSLIFPHRLNPAATQPELQATAAETVSPAAPVAAAAASDFGFDFMDESSTPPSPEPAGLDLPELDEALPQPAAEDDTFSWDDEPESAAAAPAATGTGPDDDFEWGEETDQDTAEEDVLEEAGGDDTFGLDLSWDSDLPALDEDPIEEDAPLVPMDNAGLPDWDFDEEPQAEAQKAPKPKGQEEPSNPFELRGPGADAPVPAPAQAVGTIQAELPFELETAAETESLTSAAAATVVAVTALAPEVLQIDTAEELPGTPVAAAAPAFPSLIHRGIALLADLLVLAGAILLFLVAGEAALAPEDSQRLLPSTDVLLTLAIPYFLVLFSVCFGYFTLFHFLTGQTPGKMLLRLRVETEAGAPLAFSQAFLRSTGGLFSLLLLGLGFLAIVFDRRHRGWNDRLAGTQVVAAATIAETDQ